MPKLTVLCVTRVEDYAWPFLRAMSDLATASGSEFVLALDGEQAQRRFAYDQRSDEVSASLVFVQSRGYVESVLDEAIDVCSGEYVFRLDDDESCSGELAQWILFYEFLKSDHWKFPRLHLWGNQDTALVTPHLWPDWQTRLSVKAKAGGRHTVHAGSPFGGGEECPQPILHHKFLVKTLEERIGIAEGYDRFSPGYGTGGMAPFSLPEAAYRGQEVVMRSLITGVETPVQW